LVDRDAEEVTGVGLSISANGGIIFALEGGAGEHRLRRLPVTPGGEPEGAATESPTVSGAQLFTARPLGEDHLSILLETCEGRFCLSAELWDHSGASRGTALAGPLPAFTTVKNATTGRELILGLGREGAPPELVHFTRTPQGISSNQVELPGAGEERTEMLGMSGDGERWAAIYRVGAAEGHGSEVRLASSAAAPRSIEALHDALAIESMKITDGGVAVIAAFEFSRPRFMTLGLGADGEDDDTEPLLVPPGALPPVFEGARRAFLRDDGDRLLLDVETGAGDPIARRIPVLSHVGSPRPPADVTRQGDAFLIVTRTDADLVTIEVTCREPSGTRDAVRQR